MLKLGIIGSHTITEQMLDAAQKSGYYQLTSVYSRSKDRAQTFGQPYGATQFFDDLAAFFDEGDFDVVYIASPNSCHFAQAKLAIEHDKQVIVEKPAFVNPVQFREIKSLLQAHPQAHLVEAARHMYTAIYHLARKKVDSMHPIQGATITTMKYSSRYDKVLDPSAETPNIFNPEFAGGALMDLGVYAVYLAVDLFGRPKFVHYYPTMTTSGVDGKGVAILTYDDFTVTLNVGKTANSYLPTEIYGLKDALVFDNAFDTRHVSYYDSHQQEHELIPDHLYGNTMLDEMKAFAKMFAHQDDLDVHRQYEEQLKLAEQVNTVMYQLRQSANLSFPSDQQSTNRK